MLSIRRSLFLSLCLVVSVGSAVLSILILFGMISVVLCAFIVLLADGVDWRGRCGYGGLVGSGGGRSGVVACCGAGCGGLLCVLLLVLRGVVRGTRGGYRGVGPAVGGRSLRRDRLYTSLVVGVVGDVECRGDVLDGVRGVGLVVRRRGVRRVVALVVQRRLPGLSRQLLDELVLPPWNDKQGVYPLLQKSNSKV